METVIEKLGKVSVTTEGEHSINRSYRRLSIVTVTDSGQVATFISKKDVPVGIAVINSEYWMRLGFDRAIEIPTLRTINNEQITDNSLGNVNMHDGFYFPNAVQDYDGNWYGAVVIGNQVWLGENLRTTHYADGTAISEETQVVETPAYYNKTTSQIPLEYRGLFYNWYAVMNGEEFSNENPIIQGISPNGWHIPTIEEYAELKDYVDKQKRYAFDRGFTSNNDNVETGLKPFASLNWWNDVASQPSYSRNAPGINPTTNNYTGLNLIPCGSNSSDGDSVHLWTATKTQSYACYVWGDNATNVFYTITNYAVPYNKFMSVRCVSDLTPIQFRNWYIQQYGSLQHHLSDSVPSKDSNVRIVNLTTIVPSEESSSPTIECDTSVIDMLMDVTLNNTCIIIKSRTVAIEDNEEIEQYSMYFIPATIILENAYISFIGYTAVFGGWFIVTLACYTDGTSDNFYIQELINGNKFTIMLDGIPMPTYGDEGKILKVDNNARYYLAEP